MDATQDQRSSKPKRDYVNAQERATILQFTTILSLLDDVLKIPAIHPAEERAFVEARGIITDTLHDFYVRMGKDFFRAIINDSKNTQATFFTEYGKGISLNVKSESPEYISVDRKNFGDVLDMAVVQCIGCESRESLECPLRRLMDATDRKPVNRDSEYCQYRLDSVEMNWGEGEI